MSQDQLVARKPNTSHYQGFTVMEMLTITIIITLLVAIAIPNFIHLQENAKEAQIESNARTLRIMLETYRVDHKIYPDKLRTLGREASDKNYNRYLENPYSIAKGYVESGKWAIDFVGSTGPPGIVAYQPISNGAQYYIFGYTKEGKLMKRKGKVYTLTNG